MNTAWILQKKTFVLIMATAAVAFGLSACGKGFKSTDKKTSAGQTNIPITNTGGNNTAGGSTGGSGTTSTPNTAGGVTSTDAQVQAATTTALLELAGAQSPEIQNIVNSSGSQAKVDAQVGFALIDLQPNTTKVNNGSVLFISVTVTGADGKTASTLLVENNATLALYSDNSGNVKIDGYWTITRPGNAAPYYVGLNSQIQGAMSGNPTLQGSIVANFGQLMNGAATLSTFNQPICNLIIEPTPVMQYFDGAPAVSCSAGE